MTASSSSSSHFVASSPMSPSLNADLSSSYSASSATLSDASVLSSESALAPAPLSAELSSMSPNLVSPLEASDLSSPVSASSSPPSASPLPATISPNSSMPPSPSTSASEDNPFVDRLGRFKRGTYRSMLMQMGMSYDHAKALAEQAALAHKNAKKGGATGATHGGKASSLAKNEIAENQASEATIEVAPNQVTLSESQAQPEPFSAYHFLRQLQDQGVDGATAEKIAHQAYTHHKEAEAFDEAAYYRQMVENGAEPLAAADIARKTGEAKRRDPLERYGIRLKPRRTPDPVHRDSYDVGEREHSVWKPVNPNEIGAYLEAVDQYSIKTGKVSGKAVRLLKMMFRMVDFKTGRLEPTLDTICEWVGYSRATIVRLLNQLKDNGFLRWIRRSIKIKADGKGPRRKQTSNAYGFSSPKAWPDLARQAFARVMRRKNIPVSDDIAHAQETDKAETEAMVESLPDGDWVNEIFAQKRIQRSASQVKKEGKEDKPNELAETLARFAKSIEQAEQREKEELAKNSEQAAQSEVKTSSPISKEDTSKTPQILDNQREFNSDTLSCYSYLNNNNSSKLIPTERNMDCLAPANAGSTDVLLDIKPQPDRFSTELNTLNLRPDQITAILQHRNKRKEQRMMPLSPKDIADLLVKTGQMRP
ncbi:MAG: helix-turn-helix domain-containing protein [Zymomonas mobilis]